MSEKDKGRKQMNKREKTIEYVGQLILGDKVDVTDPCYDKSAWCRETVSCKPGIYTGYATISDEGEWGIRVANLSIYKDNASCPIEDMECVSSNIGVDSGLAGFFNSKPDFSDEEWYELCDKTDSKDKKAWCMFRGIFSESGYGDGSYELYANKDRTAFTLIFV